MADRLLLRFGDNWAVLTDRRQWILARRRTDRAKGGETWRGIAFVSSTRACLERVMAEQGVEPLAEAHHAVANSFPATFGEWCDGQDRADREVA